jgi:hypothetical protein
MAALPIVGHLPSRLRFWFHHLGMLGFESELATWSSFPAIPARVEKLRGITWQGQGRPQALKRKPEMSLFYDLGYWETKTIHKCYGK